ncbi:MAG: methylated-DNA--[protein]-cysteine S-methyltransferase [Eubacteriales bacterium]|nr:methylated-DNA--[protein]-cysteine S-methyltransferase [Eubacteriales bacterium]
MERSCRLDTPLGLVILTGDALALTSLRFVGQRYFPDTLPEPCGPDELPVFAQTADWLSLYFSGRDPGFLPPLRPEGTPFRRAVWAALLRIPYGQTVSYGELAAALEDQTGSGRVSARAVGGAVGRNPISLLIPCHRVVGADGSLTGYAGGLERKRLLLRLEQGL